MSSSSKEGPLETIARPLRFAARRNFQNLGVLKGLEGTLKKSIQTARAGLGPGGARTLDALEPLVNGLDGAGPDDKKTRVKKILNLIDTADNRAPENADEVAKKRPKAPSAKKLAKAAPKAQTVDSKKRVKMAEAEPGTPLAQVIGVGPKTADRFFDVGLHTAQDALFFLPRRYEDRSELLKIHQLEPDQYATFRAEILHLGARPTGRGKRVFEVVVADGTGTVSMRFFQFKKAAMQARYKRGEHVIVSGKVTFWGQMCQMMHPDVEVLGANDYAAPPGIVPIYADIEGIPSKKVRAVLGGLAEGVAHKIEDHLPSAMRDRLRLPELKLALKNAHLPSPGGPSAPNMRKRLVFDELLLFQLALAVTRKKRDNQKGLEHVPDTPWPDLAERLFPFELTGAQKRVSAQIAGDLMDDRPMNRLLQGDVGSGKTAVALLSADIVRAAGRQTALLVPTEILAAQHFRSAQKLLSPHGCSVGLLTGSTKAKDRRGLLEALSTGELDLIIGTHALLEPDVVFSDLGLAIIDEQHRFGVHQRATLRAKRPQKGKDQGAPDILVMTATPIPRTLSLTAYGDLRVSIIDEMPPGRTPTETCLYGQSNIEVVYRKIEGELSAGRQGYIVFPLVEASEKLDLKAATDAVEELSVRFKKYNVALLHGRMRPDEKAQTMAAFVAGQVDLLVSTTVIEVGVDVPNATVMAVQHAERFGLSQLHQLRGRVGRGEHGGLCLLVSGAKDDVARHRLQVMEDSNDGFYVAERDLEIRGPGELLGTRQSGISELVLADLVRDAKLVELAAVEAERMIDQDPQLQDREVAGLRRELLRRFAGRFDLVEVG